MLITTAAFLTTVGFVCSLFGYVTQHYEIAVIGGVLILGVGGVVAGAGGGLETKTGETEIQVDNTTTTTENEYSPVETPTKLPLGSLVMILGGAIVLRSFNDFSKL
jgi:hypothetical protein